MSWCSFRRTFTPLIYPRQADILRHWDECDDTNASIDTSLQVVCSDIMEFAMCFVQVLVLCDLDVTAAAEIAKQHREAQQVHKMCVVPSVPLAGA